MKTQAREKEEERARDQAKAQLESITEMVNDLLKAQDEDNHTAEEDARERINEDALDVNIRSGWTVPGQKMKGEEFLILLCTGGPAVRIVGDLDQYSYPEKARIEYQDWFTPWIDYPLTEEEEGKVLIYCQQFYFDN
jgi:hypothetical protein